MNKKPASKATKAKTLAKQTIKKAAKTDVHPREFLVGDLVKTITKELRSLDTHWSKLPKAKQEALLTRVTMDVKNGVRKALDIIIADQRTAFRPIVDSVTYKDGVKIVLSMKNTEASHQMADVQGQSVLVVIETAERYMGNGQNIPKPEDDQKSLI